ncbi:MAG: hypothetical protein K0S02_1638 [Achromobacter mucicolens]|nr:hypothetical protein [Achromobacter mucicolens]
MSFFRYGRFGSALVEACSMAVGYSFDMSLRGWNRCLNNSEMFEDFVQTLSKSWAGGCHPCDVFVRHKVFAISIREAFIAQQERLYFDHCEPNFCVKCCHLHVRKRSHLALKVFHVAREIRYRFGRLSHLFVRQQPKLSIQAIDEFVWTIGVHLRSLQLLFEPRKSAVQIGRELCVACALNFEQFSSRRDLPNHMVGGDDLKRSLGHRLDFGTAMGPERNGDCSQGGGEARKRPDPFPFGAELSCGGPILPIGHRNARHCASNSHSNDKNFRTAKFSHASSVRVDDESYSVMRGVSA